MHKKRSKPSLKIYLSILLAFIFMVGSIYFCYKIELKKNPLVEDKLSSLEVGNLYDFYVTSIPNIQNRPFYGDEKANIHIIAFLDIDSESSKFFISEIFPKLEEEHIKTGNVKFYHKNYITREDFNKKNDNYISTISLHCVGKIRKESYYPFYFDIFKISGTKDIPELLEKYNISREEFNNCLKEEEFKEIKEDMAEVGKFGLIGINPNFYIGIERDNTILTGVPQYEKFTKTIREYGLTIGG